MKRDSIFYKLFRQSPMLLFELVPSVPDEASRYRFDSVAVKEPKFEIDGVLLPPEGSIGTVFFIEVQFQKDEAYTSVSSRKPRFISIATANSSAIGR